MSNLRKKSNIIDSRASVWSFGPVAILEFVGRHLGFFVTIFGFFNFSTSFNFLSISNGIMTDVYFVQTFKNIDCSWELYT